MTDEQLTSIEARATALHGEIINLGAMGGDAYSDAQAAYRGGHRDARHEAAELASEVSADTRAAVAEVRRLHDCAAELAEVRAAILRALEELDSDDPQTALGARLELTACANPKYRQVRPGVWGDATKGAS